MPMLYTWNFVFNRSFTFVIYRKKRKKTWNHHNNMKFCLNRILFVCLFRFRWPNAMVNIQSLPLQLTHLVSIIFASKPTPQGFLCLQERGWWVLCTKKREINSHKRAHLEGTSLHAVRGLSNNDNLPSWFFFFQKLHLDIQMGEHIIDHHNEKTKDSMQTLEEILYHLIDQAILIARHQEYQRVNISLFLISVNTTNRGTTGTKFHIPKVSFHTMNISVQHSFP